MARDRTSCSQLQKCIDFHRNQAHRAVENTRSKSQSVLSFPMLLCSSCGEFAPVFALGYRRLVTVFVSSQDVEVAVRGGVLGRPALQHHHPARKHKREPNRQCQNTARGPPTPEEQTCRSRVSTDWRDMDTPGYLGYFL